LDFGIIGFPNKLPKTSRRIFHGCENRSPHRKQNLSKTIRDDRPMAVIVRRIVREWLKAEGS